eukprot:8134633-Lingulodinium_polyedra.AAC.1
MASRNARAVGTRTTVPTASATVAGGLGLGAGESTPRALAGGARAAFAGTPPPPPSDAGLLLGNSGHSAGCC